MSMEELVAALERDARRRARSLTAGAVERAREIRRQARREVRRRWKAHRKRRLAELRAEAARREERVRRDAEESELAARAACLDRIFEAAVSQLEEAAGSEAYRRVLPDHLAAALRHVGPGDGDVEVLVRPDLAEAARAALEEGARDVEARVVGDEGAAPGVLVRAEDGRVEVDNTLPERLARRRGALAVELVRRIEGDRETGGEGDRGLG